jgi:hypothetical protein
MSRYRRTHWGVTPDGLNFTVEESLPNGETLTTHTAIRLTARQCVVMADDLLGIASRLLAEEERAQSATTEL